MTNYSASDEDQPVQENEDAVEFYNDTGAFYLMPDLDDYGSEAYKEETRDEEN